MSLVLPAAPAPCTDAARRITRGTRRALADRGFATLPEFRLPTNRRVDLLAVAPDGTIAIVEVKSSTADFQSDRKWPEYLDWCELFYFAVAEDFPGDLIPQACGLFIADEHGAVPVREPEARPLHASRRKAVMRAAFATAAGRLHRLEDPLYGA